MITQKLQYILTSTFITLYNELIRHTVYVKQFLCTNLEMIASTKARGAALKTNAGNGDTVLAVPMQHILSAAGYIIQAYRKLALS